MIFSGPGISAKTVTENVTLTDLMPTLMSLAGDTELSSLVEPIEGRDLSGLMCGQDGFDNVAHTEVMSDGLSAPIFMIRRDDWKLIWGPDYPVQLFDLAADPDEQTNRAHGPDAVEDVRDKLMAEVERMWDAEALQQQIDTSIARRLLIRKAHDHGDAPNWDYIAPSRDEGRWCRTGSDYNAWAYSVLNPR